MKIYVDNNILVSIEKNEIDINELKDHFGKNAHFVYSYIHLQELLEAKINFETLKRLRFDTIRRLTNNKQIKPIVSREEKFFINIEDPNEVLMILKEHNYINERMHNSSERFNNIDREKRINNYSDSEVLDFLNKTMTKNWELNLNELINPMGVFMHEQISSIFNFLDFVGFWKDKNTNRANMARMYDASHAYFASGCDFFVSNDRNARMKSKVAYKFKDLNTKVIDWKLKND